MTNLLTSISSNEKKVGTIFKHGTFLLWLIILGSLWAFFNRMAHTPLFENRSIDRHQVYKWVNLDSKYLIGDGTTHLYARSKGDSFVISDENHIPVAVGAPVEIQPGETLPTFEADFIPAAGIQYSIRGYAYLYTLSPAEIKFEVDRFGYPLLSTFIIGIFIFSIVIYTLHLFGFF